MEPAGLAPFPPWWGKDICELRRLRGGLNCTSGKHQLHILCADSRKRPLAALKIAAKSLHISGDEECIYVMVSQISNRCEPGPLCNIAVLCAVDDPSCSPRELSLFTAHTNSTWCKKPIYIWPLHKQSWSTINL